MRSFFLWVLAAVILFLVVPGAWFFIYINTPTPGTGTVDVFIPKGTGVRQIKNILARNGLIRDDFRFLVLARLTGRSKQLRAGEFVIGRGLLPAEVLDILVRGEVIQHRLTIPEGLTAHQIAALFAKDQWVNEKEFLSLCSEPEFIHALGIGQDRLEGYLFPDTYVLVRGESNARTIITTMVNRFLEVWQTVSVDDFSLDRHQVITLASIIEKETGVQDERPLIARVFLNRLERSMRLQSDPTVIYGLEDFNGNLTRKDLNKETPYNTYIIKGLPPGPICSPGQAAIEAVFHPALSNALYFVAKKDGTHYFSNTLKEHNKAVRKFQR